MSKILYTLYFHLTVTPSFMTYKHGNGRGLHEFHSLDGRIHRHHKYAICVGVERDFLRFECIFIMWPNCPTLGREPQDQGS